jgi:hypothetical protein
VSPIVSTYLVWGLIAAVLSVVLFFFMKSREEVPPKLRPFAAVGMAILLIVIGPRSTRRWTTGTRSDSTFSRSVANAKQQTAQLEGMRARATAAIESAKTKSDVAAARELVQAGDALFLAGYPSDALPAFDRAHALLLSLGAGNGDWAVDSVANGYFPHYIEALRGAGRSKEAGLVSVLDDKIRGIHPGRAR